MHYSTVKPFFVSAWEEFLLSNCLLLVDWLERFRFPCFGCSPAIVADLALYCIEKYYCSIFLRCIARQKHTCVTVVVDAI
jgi:hypothetical protein